MTLEEVWRIREEDIYPQLFQTRGRGVFVLSQAVFQHRFGTVDIDPRWLFCGVFEFAPTVERPFWAYATSGHSNPWHDQSTDSQSTGLSGAGVEFLLATTEQANWAIRQSLDMLAFDLLLRNGRFPGKLPLAPGDRIPLNGAIDGDEKCLLRALLVTRAEDPFSGFDLPSGRVRFLVLTGATDAETTYARANGTERLVEVLRARNFYPVTDVSRPTLF